MPKDDAVVEMLKGTINKLEEEIISLKENYNTEKYKADTYMTKYKSLKTSQGFPLTEKTGQNILSLLETLTSKNRINTTLSFIFFCVMFRYFYLFHINILHLCNCDI